MSELLFDNTLCVFPKKSFCFRFLNGQPYELQIKAGKVYEFINIYFEPDVVLTVLTEFIQFSKFCVDISQGQTIPVYDDKILKIKMESSMDNTLQRIFALLPPVPLQRERYEMNSNVLLVDALETLYPNKIKNNFDQLPEWLKVAINYIQENINGKNTYPEIARNSSTNEYKLKQGFNEYFNKTPKEFVTEEKIRASVQLILKTDLTQEQIADVIGYCNELVFTENFQHVLNIRPKDLKRISKKLPKTQFNSASTILSLYRDRRHLAY
ncbi:MAG: AraC family transcriptional regulator [Puia sp.]|nr:AraC family transcriptional regulator [Puia sp.]